MRKKKGKYESESLIIKESGTGKEYYCSVSKLDCYSEILDFENEGIYHKKTTSFANELVVYSLRHSLIPFKVSDIYDNNYYYLFCFVGTLIGDENKNAYFQKHKFQDISNNFWSTYTLQDGNFQSNEFGNGMSCFQTNSGVIICFFATKIDEVIYLNLVKYDITIDTSISSSFILNISEENNFYKCIHLEGEVGIFAYYSYISDIIYTTLLFREFSQDSDSFVFYLPDSYVDSSITLQKYLFNNNLLLNDIIKLTTKKIAFSTVSTNKEKMYIIILNISEDKNIKVRYYSIDSFSLYHYKIYLELRIHKYKNF